MSQVFTLATNKTITANGQTAQNLGIEELVGQNAQVSIEVEVTAVSGTSPSVQFSVLWSNDGINWAAEPDNVGPAITAVGNVVATVPVRGALFALAYAVTGTTPSFTFSASAYI